VELIDLVIKIINKLCIVCRELTFVYRHTACHLAEPTVTRAFLPHRKLFKESLMGLKKLHCILEILCLARERLPLSNAEQEAQTRKLYDYFAKNPLDWDKTFHFDISMNSIAPVLPGYAMSCSSYVFVIIIHLFFLL
jgi:hypothetical protein